jgi:tetratricopeptide (TPR) repeat protein
VRTRDFRFLYLAVSFLALTLFLVSGKAQEREKGNSSAQTETESDTHRENVRKCARVAEILLSLSKDEMELRDAASQLAETGEIAVEVLKEKTSSSDQKLAQTAVKALDGLAQFLIQRIADEDYESRDRTQRILFAIGEPALPHLKKLAGSKDEGARFFARRLAQMIEFGVSPDLYEKIGTILADYDHLNWRDRMSAISEVERLGGHDALECLRKIFLREKSALVRLQAANSLLRASKWSPEVAKFLQKEGVERELLPPAITYEVFISQGIKYQEAQKYQESVEEFKKALKEYPLDFRANYYIALSYLHLKDFAQSIAHFKVCVEQEPQNISALYNIACAYSLSGDIDEAIRHLAFAIKYGYDDAEHLEKDSDLKNIRSDPRYGELLRSMKEKMQK